MTYERKQRRPRSLKATKRWLTILGMSVLGSMLAHQGRTDIAGRAGYENTHVNPPQLRFAEF